MIAAPALDHGPHRAAVARAFADGRPWRSGVRSALVRSLLALRHHVTSYWPDEWIYAGLSRSIAHGHLTIHGDPAHFPAILQPLLAAPLWRFFSTETAYQLIQVGECGGGFPGRRACLPPRPLRWPWAGAGVHVRSLRARRADARVDPGHHFGLHRLPACDRRDRGCGSSDRPALAARPERLPRPHPARDACARCSTS